MTLKNFTGSSYWSEQYLHVFRGENENLFSSADFLHKTSNLAISCCYFADDGKEMDTSEKRHAGHARLLFLSTKYANL